MVHVRVLLQGWRGSYPGHGTTRPTPFVDMARTVSWNAYEHFVPTEARVVVCNIVLQLKSPGNPMNNHTLTCIHSSNNVCYVSPVRAKVWLAHTAIPVLACLAQKFK